MDELGTVVSRRMGDRPAADEAMPAVDRSVVLVAECRYSDIHLLEAVFSRLGLGELDRPAGITILLP